MPDLSTTYLGLPLKNPLLASASPLSRKVEKAQQLEQAGIAGIVMFSLFEEQIIHESLELDHYLARGADSSAEASSYLMDTGLYTMGPEKYLDQVSALKKALKIPVIGSLNGVSMGGWTKYARLIQDAGADALELNLYFIPVDPGLTARTSKPPRWTWRLRSRQRRSPAVKLSPYYTALPNFANHLVRAGADGLVLFNRFYQPDLDLEQLEVTHTLDLSTSADLRLPLRWISILHDKVGADLALTSGVHTALDVLKTMMAGARAVMTASSLLHNGPQAAATILAEMTEWMKAHEYTSIAQMQGSMSQAAVREPAAYERANYMKVLGSFRELP
jgi:dihydroorotate dehydrogenase (fumarate)